jgi:methionyl-tRNA synthetase
MGAPAKIEKCMDDLRVADALDEVWTVLRRSNKYIDETTPWILARDEANRARLGGVLYNLLESIRHAAVLLYPFLPETAERIFAQLGTDKTSYESLENFGGLTPGTHIGNHEVLFKRLDEKEVLDQIAKANAPEPPPFPPISSKISIDDFFIPDLRAARVLSCEAVPKSDKLLKFVLDIGFETRQVVSGIAKWYKPEELVGKTVILVANLKPAVIRGVDSNGMILSVDDKDDTVRLITLPEGTTPGAKIR